MRIAIGCDHRGIDFKQKIIQFLEANGHEVQDCGSYTPDAVDYPDIAQKVCELVVKGDVERGILMCGTGIGMSLAANKVKGIRGALCHNTFCALRSRQHNDANVLCMGSEIVDVDKQMPEIVNTFITEGFEGGRHQRRVDKLTRMENE